MAKDPDDEIRNTAKVCLGFISEGEKEVESNTTQGIPLVLCSHAAPSSVTDTFFRHTSVLGARYSRVGIVLHAL